MQEGREGYQVDSQHVSHSVSWGQTWVEEKYHEVWS